MAIETGNSLLCADLQATGGLQKVLIRRWNSDQSGSGLDEILFGGTGAHTIVSIMEGGGNDSTWGAYDAKLESSSLTISGTTAENGVSTYECSLVFTIPSIDLTHLNKLQEFTGEALQVMVIDTNGDLTSGSNAAGAANYLVLGISKTLAGSDDNQDQDGTHNNSTRPQTFARLASIEANTGAAFSDENSAVVTITATMHELPRAYVNTDAIVYNAAGTVATVK
tara:strand:+ start:53 stop:724 length:672 start_codon:yes stop_codon:yes gene_type:complete